ncbi:GGDEF domain-containing protein [Azohydromonas caseinilytica]|uniref:diguanylate cyclase n=1 Tax=Azohydromonas caseinilytica TaxID=2728836 RepID=A0A848FIR2_9BURK|nr:GGDEF domain-containing protein [Azohydromonas caseinilytica]NML18785.1 GGDEF domain-containing protein [Azohydromonas caseinilytica]
MTLLIDQLAELTGHRDRRQADAFLLETLRELLEPVALALHRCVGEAPEQRWLTCAQWRGEAGRRPYAAARRYDFDLLPTLESRPEWAECARHTRIVELPGSPAVTLLPLVAGAQCVGVVELHSTRPLAAYMLRSAAALVRLYGNFLALLDYGERDALTGLFNRKTFNDSFMRVVLELGAAQRGGLESEAAEPPRQFFLAAVDLDHFKGVNDQFGHLVGDEVLLLTARVMRTVLRLDDGLFRFGGEEFVVLLETPGETEAWAALERLRLRLQEHHFPQVGQVTVSIGFTDVRSSDLPPTAMERADRALLLAKSGGRNRVVGPAAVAAAGVNVEIAHGGDVDLF